MEGTVWVNFDYTTLTPYILSEAVSAPKSSLPKVATEADVTYEAASTLVAYEFC
jgi:hypothetical protein